MGHSSTSCLPKTAHRHPPAPCPLLFVPRRTQLPRASLAQGYELSSPGKKKLRRMSAPTSAASSLCSALPPSRSHSPPLRGSAPSAPSPAQCGQSRPALSCTATCRGTGWWTRDRAVPRTITRGSGLPPRLGGEHPEGPAWELNQPNQ